MPIYGKHLTRHKMVYERHEAGETYVSIGKELGLSASRVRNLALRWARELVRQKLIEKDNKGNWIVEIRDFSDNVLDSWSLNDNLPLPQIGYTIWLKGSQVSYDVTGIYIGYDECKITISVEKF